LITSEIWLCSVFLFIGLEEKSRTFVRCLDATFHSFKTIFNKILFCLFLGFRDGSVGIATTLRVGRSGDRIPVGEGERYFFPHSYRPALWAPLSLLYNGYWGFPRGEGGGKAAGAWCWPPTPIFSAEVLKRVELYL
jgi:hypothetical protein